MTARQSWPVRRFRLGDEPGDDLSRTTSVAERLRMVETLSAEAWALTGEPLPCYARRDAPVTKRRLRQARAL